MIKENNLSKHENTDKKEKEEKDNKKYRKKTFIYLAIIILLLLLLLVKSCSCSSYNANANPNIKTNTDIKNTPDPNIQDISDNIIKASLELETDNPIINNNISNKKEEAEDMIIPGYTNLYVSNENPTIHLINPKDNTVYLKYTILENGIEIAKTKAIKPNNMADVNLKDVLSKGTHELTFNINTYDIKTEEECNSTTQKVSVTIL